MRYLTYIIIFVFQISVLLPLNAQNINKASKRANGYEYAEAIPILEKIIEKNKKDKDEAVVMLADCYRMVNEDEKAAKYYALALNQDSPDPMVYFNYGQTLRTLERYNEAGEQFRKFASLLPDDKRGELLAGFCDEIGMWLDMPVVNEPQNVASLNSPYADFSPVFYRQGAIITTERPRDGSPDETYEWTGNPYLGLMFSWLNGMVTPSELIYSKPEVFDENLDQKFHDGTVAFTDDGNTMFFTRTLQERVPKDNERYRTHFLKTYSTTFEEEVWLTPEPFFLNSDDYSIGHPAFSPDGSTLFFVSDMPGGYGGTDIWICTREGEGWSEAENLGPAINTIMDEMFPYMDEDGRLYFSSEGHMGFGGLDIYYTTKSDDIWENPVNMMRGINSSYDDFGISMDHSLGTGLLSSNRPGGHGGDDIYAFEIGKKMLMICGKVVDPDNNPLPNATVFFLNNTKNEVLILKSDSTGEYCTKVEPNTEYTILGKKTSYIDDCLELTILDNASNPNDLVLAPYEVNQVFELENIYYDLDKWYIRPDAEPPLDNLVRIMLEHPITIELGSHTDCRASDEYNIDLSQKRAESAIRYLVLNGINSARMTAKGYGETMLVNDCADGVECTEEEHQMNRRTEFKVTSIGEYGSGWTIEEQYRAGEIIHLSNFDTGFFDPCANEK